MSETQKYDWRASLLPLAALVGAMLSIGIGAALAKQLFPLVGAQGTTALRLTFAALMLTLVMRPWRARFTAQSWLPVLLYGLTMGGMNFLFYMALRSLPLGIAVALEFTGPLAVAVCSSRKAADFLWIAFAVSGLALLLPLSGGVGDLDPVGAAYALGAGACWAFYILTGRKAGLDHGTMATGLGMIIAAILVVPFGIVEAGADLLLPSVLGLGIVIGFLSSALPYSLEMYTLRRLPPKAFGTLTSLEPVVAATTGWILLSESLSPIQAVAIMLIISASIGTTLTDMREKSRVKRTELLPD
ncbi:threonine/homoserine exporter RhtA [Altericroceibacterium endophyticum]|uniref:threonine/homoserine exporter RhtA n=1 Tax=Altericroceibacterium endophyticum TaxID=1808508 RepID=UPI00301D5DDE